MESLGDNCEFAAVQKALGLDPLGLFRWSSTTIGGLDRLLSTRFDKFTDLNHLDIFTGSKQEAYIRNRRYDFFCHCHTHPGPDRAGHLLIEQRRLKLLTRKMIDDLSSGHKMFVFKSRLQPTEADVRALHRAMKQYGTSELLWVSCTTRTGEVGKVRRIDDGLLHGWVDAFAPANDVLNVSLDAWVSVARNAHRLRVAGAPPSMAQV